jgi:exopolysaccharide production protein ExoZ
MSKLPNIQILRAIAALAVVLYHCGIESMAVCSGFGQSCNYDYWNGGYGVSLFFMISGFIMVATSWNAFSQPGASLDFMRRRIIRIVPLYWLLTTVAVVGIYFVPSMLSVPVLDSGYVAASYLFWPVPRINGLVRPVANLGWTLNLEMMFYAVFSIALLFSRRMGLALAICFLLALTLMQTTGIFAQDGSFSSVPLNFWADPIILNFIVGMLAAVVYKKGFHLSFSNAILLFAASIVLLAVIHELSPAPSPHPENHIMSRLGTALPPMFLFLAAALGPQVNTAKVIWRAGLLVGDASYSIYLVHPFALRTLTKLWIKMVGDHLPVWSFNVLSLLVALAAGLTCYAFVERPLVNYFNAYRSTSATALRPRPGV